MSARRERERERGRERMRAFFYDTWAFLALANARDRHHAETAELDRRLERAGYTAATSDYVLDEVLTGLHRSAGAKIAIAFLDLIAARIDAQELLLLEVTSPRRERAIAIFRKLAGDEPRLSFTDCTSLGVMREMGIQLAFTADRHFHRGAFGIRPLFEWERDALVRRWPTELLDLRT